MRIEDKSLHLLLLIIVPLGRMINDASTVKEDETPDMFHALKLLEFFKEMKV